MTTDHVLNQTENTKIEHTICVWYIFFKKISDTDISVIKNTKHNSLATQPTIHKPNKNVENILTD